MKKGIVPVSDEIKARVIDRINEIYSQFPTLSKPHVLYTKRGRYGGEADKFENSINLNSVLLNENVDTFIKQTVGHECAHLIAYFIYGNIAWNHGYYWKSIMHRIGLEAKRCHNYDTTNSKVRKTKRYSYSCNCNSNIPLSSVRHNRMQRTNTFYRCVKCHSRLVYNGKMHESSD